ncbi:MAG: PD40 domain-containing protein [Deltaproteobacteria bacterium]|nr:PD40 domain-containing protein [Deltaproteobacteria bacterium]
MKRVHAVGAFVVCACAATAAAQFEDANHLTAPAPETAHLLELAAGLERPPAGETARRVVAAAPTPTAEPPLSRRLETDTAPADWRLSAATRTSPATLTLDVGGPLGPLLRTTLASDLAYVRAVQVGDDADFTVQGETVSSRTGVRAHLRIGPQDGTRGHERDYQGPEEGLLAFAHSFADDAVEALTGRRSGFAGRLAFSRRVARGRKDIFVAAADGRNLERMSSGHGIATLPAFGPGGVFYSVATPAGVFITRSGLDDRPLIGGRRTNMGARYCNGRLYFASSRDGNMDIYSVLPDGTDERRLTDDEGIDVSPTCAPGGNIAFVSSRRGRPQVFLRSAGDGPAANIEQLTDGPGESQTPALCGRFLAYTEVEDGMRVVLLNRETGVRRQVSPRTAGDHQDPAFSPGCRMLAWVGPEGLLVARRDGHLRRVIVESAPGALGTVRWER